MFYLYYLLFTKPNLSLEYILKDGNMMDVEDGPISALQSQVPSIVKAIHKQMREKSVRTRQGCFMLLTKVRVRSQIV